MMLSDVRAHVPSLSALFIPSLDVVFAEFRDTRTVCTEHAVNPNMKTCNCVVMEIGTVVMKYKMVNIFCL